MMMVLKAELVGWHRGKKIPRPYRAVLVMPDVDGPRQPLLRVEEQLGDGYWNKTPGQWYLSTLADDLMRPSKSVGMVAIDYNEQWAVSGMNEAIVEAMSILTKGGDADGGRTGMAEAEDPGRSRP